MAVSCNKLWKLFIDKKMSTAELRKAVRITPNTMTRFHRDEDVRLTVLGKICDALGADYGDIMQYIKSEENANYGGTTRC